MSVRNSSNVSSTEGLNKEIVHSDWHSSKLYPFLLQETLYMMGSRDNAVYTQIENKEIPQVRVSFLKIKRIVNAIRYEGYAENSCLPLDSPHRKIVSKQRRKSLDNLILQSMTMVLDSNNQNSTTISSSSQRDHRHRDHRQNLETLAQRDHRHRNDISHKRWNRYNSVHSALLAIEYQWQAYASIFEGRFSAFLHPEILVRILRYQMQDVSLIHLLRQLLHQNILKLEPVNGYLRQSTSNKLAILLLNWYTLECEKFFLLEVPTFLLNNQSLHTVTSDDRSCLKKMTIWNPLLISTQNISKQQYNEINNTLSNQKKNSSLYTSNSITYKYIRTKNIWLLNIHGKQELMNILQERYMKFLQNRLGCMYNSNQLRSILVDNSSLLLGHILQFKVKHIFVRIHIDCSILKTSLKIKSISILNPLFLVVRILAAYRFCTYFGYPISKSGWATWSDTTIVDRFKRIRDSLIGYYSGSVNHKDLSRIHHILHYSCAKTLACKHKTNLRKIWTKYADGPFGRSNLSRKYKYNNKRIAFHMLGKSKNVDARRNVRCWNLHFKQPDPISILLENTYRLPQ
uniref:Maturase K n=1 Tax=Closterium baillyanum TaxID=1416941 RepID=A0A191T5Q0_9VIRI|nr:maturase K [Closterium baillyanum]ANI25725.1 maturase K [Closterium baillyanum]